MNRYPNTASRLPVPRWAVGGAAALALFATGCAEGGSATKDTNKTIVSEDTPSATTSSRNPQAGESTPPQSATPSSGPNAIGKTVVCDALFTQKTGNDAYQVIGRPVVDAGGYPEHVEVNEVGAKIEPQPHQSGEITWYDLEGEKVSESELVCNEVNIFPKRIESGVPENIAWQLTSDLQGKQPKHWDLNALKPANFAGVSLNYTNPENPMTRFDVQEIVNQAQADAAKHPVY